MVHIKKTNMTDTIYDNSTELDPRIAARLKRDAKGLVAAVVQQYDTHEVLMVGYMNDEALRRTLTTGRVTFCDGDALLVEVDQVGAACHTGKRSCFLEGGPLPVVEGHRPVEQ